MLKSIKQKNANRRIEIQQKIKEYQNEQNEKNLIENEIQRMITPPVHQIRSAASRTYKSPLRSQCIVEAKSSMPLLNMIRVRGTNTGLNKRLQQYYQRKLRQLQNNSVRTCKKGKVKAKRKKRTKGVSKKEHISENSEEQTSENNEEQQTMEITQANPKPNIKNSERQSRKSNLEKKIKSERKYKVIKNSKNNFIYTNYNERGEPARRLFYIKKLLINEFNNLNVHVSINRSIVTEQGKISRVKQLMLNTKINFHVSVYKINKENNYNNIGSLENRKRVFFSIKKIKKEPNNDEWNLDYQDKKQLKLERIHPKTYRYIYVFVMWWLQTHNQLKIQTRINKY